MRISPFSLWEQSLINNNSVGDQITVCHFILMCIRPPELLLLLMTTCHTCCSYKLRIESMLLKEEFAANMGYLEPSINSMIVAGEGEQQLWA
jgi:hypothetical protein